MKTVNPTPRINFLVFLSMVCGIGFGQPCPVITSQSLSSPDCFNGQTSCDLCLDQQVELNLEGNFLPNGGCVNWFYSSNPGFNPASGQGTLLGCASITSAIPLPCDQCPEILAILINACGLEEPNELIIMGSGSGFALNDLSITFPNPGVGGDANIPPCGFKSPTITVSGCSNVVYAGPGSQIPPGVPVIFFISSAASTVYDASALCSSGETVYVIQNSCSRLTAAFRNNCTGCGTRTIQAALACGCSSSLTYNPEFTADLDGDFYTSDGNYGNLGCPVLPAVNLAAPPPSFSDVDVFTFNTTDLMCNQGPFYIKGILNPAPSAPCTPPVSGTLSFHVVCPDASINGDDEICEGESVTLTAGGGTNYAWSNGTMGPVLTDNPSSSTTYAVTASIGPCEDEADFSVTVLPDVQLDLGTATLCETDPPIDLAILSDPNFSQGSWSGPGVTTGFFNPTGLSGTITVTFSPTDPCGAITNTDIEVNSLQTPDLLSSDVCRNGNLFDLSALEDPSFAGTWSGPGVANNQFNPAGLTGNVVLDFTPTDPCVEPASTSVNVILGGEPSLTRDTICSSESRYGLSQLADPLFPFGVWIGPGVVSNQFNATGRSGLFRFTFFPDNDCVDTATTTVLVNPAINPSLGTDTVCPSSSSYYLPQLFHGNALPGMWSGNGVMGDSLNIMNQTGSVSVIFSPSDDCVETDTTAILIQSNIQINNFRITCDSAGAFYTVYFQISGGDPNGYFVTGPGTLTGSDFESAPITNLGMYSFIVGDGVCPNIILDGAHNCGCASFAGSIRTPASIPINLCIGDSLQFVSDSTFVLDDNDTLLYVLYLGTPDSIGQIVAQSDNPLFIYDSLNLLADSVYYLSLLVGDSTSLGIHLMDTCLSMARGIPVIFHTPPTALLLGDTVLCGSGNPDIRLVFSGGSPYQFQLSENGTLIPPASTNQDTLELFFQPGGPTLYQLIAFDNDWCPGIILDSFAQVDVFDSLLLEIVDTVFNANNTYQIVLSVSGGDANTYQFTGTLGTFSGGLFTTDEIPCGTGYSVCVSDNQCGQVCQSDVLFCGTINCTTDAGSMDPDLLEVCPNSTVFVMNTGSNLDADDVLIYMIHDRPDDTLGNVVAVSTQNFFNDLDTLVPGQTYYISAVAGTNNGSGLVSQNDPCLSVSPGTPIILWPLPTVILPPDTAGCENSRLRLLVNFAGNPPYTFEYSINGAMQPIVNTSAPDYTLFLNVTGPLEIVVHSIADQNCINTTSDTLNVRIAPAFVVENVVFECDSITKKYVVSFEITGGLPGTYNVTGSPGTLTGNFFVSDSINSNDFFDFRITDGYQCVQNSLFGTYSCDCLTDAGTLVPLNPSGLPFQICTLDSVSAVSNNDAFLEVDDAFEYVLYIGASDRVDSILARNASGRFGFMPGMELGTIYFLAAVASRDDGTGRVDLNSGCITFSEGIPVFFQESPDGSFLVPPVICDGQCLDIDFQFSGVPDFLVHYEIIEDGLIQAGNFTTSDSAFTQPYCPTRGTQAVQVRWVDIQSNGCVTLKDEFTDLTIIYPQERLVQRILCEGDSLVVEGNVYNQQNPSDTLFLPFPSSNGCDSLVVIDLGFIPLAREILDTTICETDFIIVNGRRYDVNNPSGVERFSTATCDSILTVQVSFYPPQSSIFRDTICENDRLVYNGTVYDINNPGGTEILNTVNGCDSTVQVELSFLAITQSTILDTVCPDYVLTIGNFVFNQANPAGTAVIANNAGCDSIILVDLEYLPVVGVLLEGGDSICSGDTSFLQVNMFGTTTANVEIVDDQGNTIPLSGVTNGQIIRVSPNQTTTYSLVNASVPGYPCTVQQLGNVTILVSQLDLGYQISNFNGFNVSCNGGSDAIVTIQPRDGAAPYRVDWADGSSGEIRNSLTAGLYLFTITDGAGCKVDSSIFLTEPDLFFGVLESQRPGCGSDSTGFLRVIQIDGGVGPFSYSVDNGSIQLLPAILPLELGGLPPDNYALRLIDANGCIYEERLTIGIAPEPSVSLGRDTIIPLGESIFLIAQTNILPDQVIWTPNEDLSCDTCLTTIATPLQNTTYQIRVLDDSGCDAMDEITIGVFTLRKLYVPSAFSPNGDGINDGFTIYGGKDAEIIENLLVFDRWGNLVFEKNNIPLNLDELGWDGTYKGQVLDPAVFVFLAEVRFKDGVKEVFKGDIMLVR